MARIKKREKMKHSIEEAIEEYMQDCINRNLSERSIHEYQSHLRSFMLHIGVDYLEDINDKVIQRYVSELPKYHQYSEKSFNNHARFINIFFNWCVEQEYIEKIKIKYKKVEKKLQHVPTTLEVKRLIQTPDITEISYSRLSAWLVCVIITGTGLRVGSIVNLKKSDINLKESVLYIRKTKQRQEMIVKLSPKLKKAIKFYLDVTDNNSDWLITNQYTDEPLQAKVMSNNVRRYGEFLGIKISCHSLRRYFACQCVLSGMPLIQLSRLLGHSSVQMTEVYIQSLGVEDFETKYTNPLERL